MSLYNKILLVAEVIILIDSFLVKITVNNPLKTSQKEHRFATNFDSSSAILYKGTKPFICSFILLVSSSL